MPCVAQLLSLAVEIDRKVAPYRRQVGQLVQVSQRAVLFNTEVATNCRQVGKAAQGGHRSIAGVFRSSPPTDARLDNPLREVKLLLEDIKRY